MDDVYVREDLYHGKYAPDQEAITRFEAGERTERLVESQGDKVEL